MPTSLVFDPPGGADPVELSVEDAILDTWVEDSGDYLRLDSAKLIPPGGLQPDQA